MEKIESKNNEKLRAARAIRDGRMPESIFVEGDKLVSELAASGLPIAMAFVSSSYSGSSRGGGLIELLHRAGTAIYLLSESAFSSVADTKTPQGIIAIAKRPRVLLDDIAKRIRSGASPLPIVVYLEAVNNPANLGAIIRTAEAAGAVGIITSDRSADAFSPKALRGAMGSAFRSQIVEGLSCEDLLRFARAENLTISTTVVGGGVPYTEIDWRRKRVLIFGSEASGVSHGLLSQSNETIAIQMEPPVESLNLAVSCGVMLFHARTTAVR